MSKKILFFGNERLATGVTTDLPVLKGLVAAGYEIPAIIIAQSEASSSRKQRPLEVLAFASGHGIEVLTPEHLSLEPIQQYGAGAGVLVAYGKLVPEAVIDSFPRGIINLHPSLLPKHRGSTPIEHTILNGDSETGVSLMQLAATMDTGDVFVQGKIKLKGDESKQALADQLGSVGASLFAEHLPAILEGSLPATAQDETLASYDEQLSREDGELDFHKPAVQLEREVRAYAGWPRSRTSLKGIEVIITSCHITNGNGAAGDLALTDKQLGVYTVDGLLVIDTLIPAGKPEMSAAAFLAGYRIDQ